jgi:nitroreductase
MDYADLLELQSRQRAVRSFDAGRPVEDGLIQQMLGSATRAPSGGNRQTWRFIVVRDADLRGKLAAIYEEEAARYLGRPVTGQSSWRDVPVLVVFCSEAGGGGPSIFPAVQNFLLAAQTLGLGSVLTTLRKAREPEVRSLLVVPDDVELHAILPIGWPDRKYGRNRRRPVEELTYRDRYGEPW